MFGENWFISEEEAKKLFAVENKVAGSKDPRSAIESLDEFIKANVEIASAWLGSIGLKRDIQMLSKTGVSNEFYRSIQKKLSVKYPKQTENLEDTTVVEK